MTSRWLGLRLRLQWPLSAIRISWLAANLAMTCRRLRLYMVILRALWANYQTQVRFGLATTLLLSAEQAISNISTLSGVDHQTNYPKRSQRNLKNGARQTPLLLRLPS